MRRVLTGAVITTLVAAGVAAGVGSGAVQAAPGAVTSSATSAPSARTAAVGAAAYTPPRISWGTCDDTRLQQAGAKCGMLVVPLDYARPSGTKIKIAVSRIGHASGVRSQGPMLVNPGGPGGSGLSLSRLGSAVPQGAGKAYDWIGFDPRGVGASEPSLACDGDYFGTNRPDYVTLTTLQERVWLDKTRAYAEKCDAAGGALLDHLTTLDNVRDMESLRKALGASKINFYGFSYGTYLGQVYATQYPDRVRRMVLDGVVDPRDVWYEANLNQDVAFEKTLTAFFAWVARNDATYGLGTTTSAVREKWLGLLQSSREAPLGGTLGPDEVTDAFLSAGYYVYGWTDTAEAFRDAVAGSYDGLAAAYADANGAGPGSDNGYAVYLGTQCTDVRWPQSFATWREDNWATYGKAPFETWANAWYNAPCLAWGAKARTTTPPTVSGTKAPAVLLIAEQYDAATPYPGAIEVRKRFPRSVLIKGVGGTTHSGSLSGVSCTDNRIAAYLLTGKLDARKKGSYADVSCPPVPAPDPTDASGRRAATGMPADLRAVVTGAGLR